MDLEKQKCGETIFIQIIKTAYISRHLDSDASATVVTHPAIEVGNICVDRGEASVAGPRAP